MYNNILYNKINYSGESHIFQLTIEPMLVLRRCIFCLQYEDTEYKITRSLEKLCEKDRVTSKITNRYRLYLPYYLSTLFYTILLARVHFKSLQFRKPF